MRYVDIDFAIPIALLVASVGAVFVLRMAAARGQRAARARTQRLIDEHGGAEDERRPQGVGMRDLDRASE